MTERNHRDETAQPETAAQSGPSKPGTAQPGKAPAAAEEQPGGPPAAAEEAAPKPSFVVRDKRRKPSPRPRPDTVERAASRQTEAAPRQTPAQPAAAAERQPAAEQGAGSRGGKTSTDRATSGEADVQRSGRGTTPGTGEARQGRHTRRDEQKRHDHQPDGAKPGTTAFAAEVQALRTDLEERTRDLQRLTAEYANYRRRVDRDRALMAEQATGAVLADLLGVLDDIDRARDHGDLVGPFGAVADQLVSVLTKLGLTPFGDAGDAFDPSRHEAVAHSLSSEVTEPTCVQVFRRGYAFGERLLRPALVAVADPTDEEPETDTAEAPAAAAGTEAPRAAPGAEAAAGAEASGTGPDAGQTSEETGEPAPDESDVESVDTDPVEAEVVNGEVVDPEAAAVADEEAEGEGDESGDAEPRQASEQAPEPAGSDQDATAPDAAAEPTAKANAGSRNKSDTAGPKKPAQPEPQD